MYNTSKTACQKLKLLFSKATVSQAYVDKMCVQRKAVLIPLPPNPFHCTAQPFAVTV